MLLDAAHGFLHLLSLHAAAGTDATKCAHVQLQSGLLCRATGAETALAMDLASVLLAHASVSAAVTDDAAIKATTAPQSQFTAYRTVCLIATVVPVAVQCG
jgi:hypothetical protein